MLRRVCTALTTGALVAGGPLAAAAPADAGAAAPGAPGRATTAWRDGKLQVDTAGLVSRSDLVLEQASWRDYESVPLGNGSLGAAVWAENGLTAQLNRNDTFPRLKSAGQLVIPGLCSLTSADDDEGRLDMYDAQLRQSGNGMTAVTYVRADEDQLVVRSTARSRTNSRPSSCGSGKVAARRRTLRTVSPRSRRRSPTSGLASPPVRSPR